jgi:hypothetical protein
MERHKAFEVTVMTNSRRFFLAFGAGAVVAAGIGVDTVWAAQPARLLDPRWARFGEDSMGPDHTVWSDFLSSYRRLDQNGVARLDYAAVSRRDRSGLEAYLVTLQGVRPSSLTRRAAFAYWVNFYNALTVWLVLEAYPVTSIKSVRGGLFGLGPWDEKITTVEGVKLSLDHIEHGILRPVWQDPRIHYALNCAAVGCPNLSARAFDAAQLDRQLDSAAKTFINHPRGATIIGGKLIVSSIYQWFKEDFGSDDNGVIAHLRQYADASLRSRLAQITTIYDDQYDWSLNGF